MVSMWVDHSMRASPGELEVLFLFPPSLSYYIFLDSLRRRLTWWPLWATRPDRPYIIVSAQAPESGRRLFAVADENVGWVLDEARGSPVSSQYPEISCQDLRSGLRANIASLLTTRY